MWKDTWGVWIRFIEIFRDGERIGEVDASRRVMNCRKGIERTSVWFYPSRLDAKPLAMWFDLWVFNPFCAVRNSFVI